MFIQKKQGGNEADVPVDQRIFQVLAKGGQ